VVAVAVVQVFFQFLLVLVVLEVAVLALMALELLDQMERQILVVVLAEDLAVVALVDQVVLVLSLSLTQAHNNLVVAQ
jgi:hypothetical protein